MTFQPVVGWLGALIYCGKGIGTMVRTCINFMTLCCAASEMSLSSPCNVRLSFHTLDLNMVSFKAPVAFKCSCGSPPKLLLGAIILKSAFKFEVLQ